jgi:hypothetical protein
MCGEVHAYRSGSPADCRGRNVAGTARHIQDPRAFGHLSGIQQGLDGLNRNGRKSFVPS